jgi:hypothetical protein
VQCIYCQQVRAKNTSRQRQHLLECPTYLSVMKDSIPANNLLHTFPEGDVARSLQIPAPTLELDFRMSIKMNPKVSVGPGVWGQREWISFIGGQWAGRWGKGIVLVRKSAVILKALSNLELQPGGQDTQLVTKDSTTNLRASYILQTVDEPPAFIIVRTEGWLTGAKDVLEKVIDSNMADGVNPGSYKYRVNLSMETGDERYTFLNSLMWIGSGCRRGHEGTLQYVAFLLYSKTNFFQSSSTRSASTSFDPWSIDDVLSVIQRFHAFHPRLQICDGKTVFLFTPFLTRGATFYDSFLTGYRPAL